MRTSAAPFWISLLSLALLRPVDGLSGIAWFNSGGVTGSINFQQDTVGSDTRISVNLTGLSNGPNAWHVHVYPVADGCQPSSVGGHYNPFNVPLVAPCTNMSLCEVGDLSGKHGKLNSTTVDRVFMDTNLPLFGEYSVVGRAIVIHAASGARMACATIEPKSDNVKRTVVGFDNGVIVGNVRMVEYDGQTAILTDLRYDSGYSGGDRPTSAGWKVWGERPPAVSGHTYSPTGGDGNGDCDVMETGGVWRDSTIGNLQDKHGNVPIGSKGFFTDTSLPLSGTGSIAGRGMSVGRLGCACVGKHARARFDGAVNGFIDLIQAWQGGVTAVEVNLNGLADTPNKWHVHVFPKQDGCGPSSVGGHYNPFNVPVGVPCPNMSDCEVGDLSGKHGAFTSATVMAAFNDTNLDLYGVRSVVGRSIVIHRQTGERYACATIAPILPVYKLKANFTGALEGSILLMQPKYDKQSETVVSVSLKPSAASAVQQSTSHNYHVHVNPINASAPDRCASAGGHWNPTEATAGLCQGTTSRPPLCEIGDLSGKHGQLNLPSEASAGIVYSDTSLPLSGSWSISGRSIVVHAANGGGARLDCASLFVDEDTESQPNSGGDSDDCDFMCANGIYIYSTIGFVVCLVVISLISFRYFKRQDAANNDEFRRMSRDKEPGNSVLELGASNGSGGKIADVAMMQSEGDLAW